MFISSEGVLFLPVVPVWYQILTRCVTIVFLTRNRRTVSSCVRACLHWRSDGLWRKRRDKRMHSLLRRLMPT